MGNILSMLYRWKMLSFAEMASFFFKMGSNLGLCYKMLNALAKHSGHTVLVVKYCATTYYSQ
jgi:hypothetical protein